MGAGGGHKLVQGKCCLDIGLSRVPVTQHPDCPSFFPIYLIGAIRADNISFLDLFQ